MASSQSSESLQIASAPKLNVLLGHRGVLLAGVGFQARTPGWRGAGGTSADEHSVPLLAVAQEPRCDRSPELLIAARAQTGADDDLGAGGPHPHHRPERGGRALRPSSALRRRLIGRGADVSIRVGLELLHDVARRPGRRRRNGPGTYPPCCRVSQSLHSSCRLHRAGGGKRRGRPPTGTGSPPRFRPHSSLGGAGSAGGSPRRYRPTPALRFACRLDATRREPASGNAPPERGAMLRVLNRWQEPEATPRIALSGLGNM